MRARAVVLLAATELWERFTHYGLRALLVLFFIAPAGAGGMGLQDARASSIYGLFVAGVYLCALAGGWLADRYLGPVRSIWLGGTLIALGNFSLVYADSLVAFGTDLAVIALGVGLLKANVTALVARAAAREAMPPDAALTDVAENWKSLSASAQVHQLHGKLRLQMGYVMRRDWAFIICNLQGRELPSGYCIVVNRR